MMIKRNITMLVIAVLLISLVACSSSMDPTNSLSTQTSVPITEPRTVEKTESVPTPTLSPLPTISPVPTAAPTIEPTDEPVPESVNPEEYIPEEQNEDFASQDVAQVPSQDSVPEPTPEPVSEPTTESTPEPNPDPNPGISPYSFIGSSISSFQSVFGEPSSSEYSTSCYGPGEDGILVYSEFTVFTYRDEEGNEVVQGVE